ncbi:MAG: hypothetical protein PHH26_00635 [Candidatus Thermoplasmatota archaeon]|nr:hypothetical protein [Candidatus Thermoplasmatota archaeon]
MTPEEHELVEKTIRLAVMDGMTALSTSIDLKIAKDISAHQTLCSAQRGAGDNPFVPLGLIARHWKTAVVGLFILISFISHFTGGKKFTTEEMKQLAQQIQTITNPSGLVSNPK